MHYRNYVILTALTCSLFPGLSQDAHAGESIGLSAKAGTLGLGVEFSTALLPYTRLRGGLNYLNYSFDSTLSNIDYEFESQFNSLSLLFDWHPFSGAFFLSGGAYINNNSFSVSGSLPPSPLPLADIVSVSGDVEFQPIAAYAGIGWRSNSGETGLGIALELGVLFQGAPEIGNLRVNGLVDVNSIGVIQDFLAEQEKRSRTNSAHSSFIPLPRLWLPVGYLSLLAWRIYSGNACS